MNDMIDHGCGPENMLGVIGGMGPMASQLFYKMVTERTAAEKDQDHLNMLILSDAGMPDRTAAILSGDEEAVEVVRRRLLQDAGLLAKNGCKAVAITCNTAHYFADMIAPELSIPIIHMIRETAAETAKSCRGERAGILATDGTIRTGLYQKALEAAGVQPYTPKSETQEKVMYEIYDCVKSGRPADMKIWAEIETELLEAGCRKALLACTELSCIRDQEGLSSFYIDPMQVLAVRALQFMGKEQKTEEQQS